MIHIMQRQAAAATDAAREIRRSFVRRTYNRENPALRTPVKVVICLQFFNRILDSLVNDKTHDSVGTKTWMKKMSRTKLSAQPSDFEGTLQSSPATTAALATATHAEAGDDLDNLFKDDTDFDVEEDIAFLGEEYDVMELDDVLELCNVGRDDSFDA